MKLGQCERESEVVAALRSGATEAELNSHIACCAACTETRKVAALMLQHAAAVDAAGQQPPMANRIWRKAQARRQDNALRRATQALAIMRALAAIYITLLLGWGCRTLWLRQSAELQPAWSALANAMVLLGAGVALAIIAAGAGFLLLLNKRGDHTFVSV
jgi:hypothetical protein